MGLPIYKVTIDDFTGVEAIAIVEDPAIEIGYQRFNKERLKFSTNEDRKILSGPIMVADLPIYRYSPDMGEYYVVFDADVIGKIVQKFFKEKRQLQINLNHDENLVVYESYFFESFIIDRKRGINPPKGYEDLTDGSWFGSLKVDDDRVWDVVKNPKFTGFSVEGLFNHELVSMKKSKSIDDVFNQISSLIDEALK